MNGHFRKNYLRSFRKKLGMTQRELAALLGRSTSCRISLLENGQVEPTVREIFIFSRVFGWPLEDLFPQWSNEMEEAFQTRTIKLMDRLQSRQGQKGRRRLSEYVNRNCVLRRSMTIELMVRYRYLAAAGNKWNVPGAIKNFRHASWNISSSASQSKTKRLM